MATKLFSCLRWLTAFTLAVTIIPRSGRAQIVSDAPAPSPGGVRSKLAVAPIPSAAPVTSHTHPAPAKAKPMTPFDRLIAPQLRKFATQSAGARPRSAPAGTRAAATGVDGSNVNFPGFVSAPFMTIKDGDTYTADSSVTADFNNDGKMDVATIKIDGTINVLLNPGTFAGIKNVSPITSNNDGDPTDIYVEYVVAADMNGDGFADLIGQDLLNNAVIVWIGKGDGTFGPPNAYPVTLASGITWFDSLGSSILVGDFNGDGSPDIVSLSYDAEYVPGNIHTVIAELTLLNDGTGRLTALPENDTTFPDYYQAGYGQAAVTTSDGAKADGLAFMLADVGFNNNYVGGVVIATMAGNGDGTFQAPVPPTGFVVPDGTIYSNTSFVATNLTAKGSGKFQQPGTPGSGFPTTDFVFMTAFDAVFDAPFTSSNPTSGRVLAGLNSDPFSTVVIPPAAPSPALPSLVNTAIIGALTMNVADMNGDGLADLVVYSPGSVAVFPNAGAGVFTAAPSQLAAGAPGMLQPQPANYDGGAYNSLISVDSQLGEVEYFQNLGAAASVQAGQFLAAPMITGTNIAANAETYGDSVQVQATADIDGDGIPDLIATTTAGDSSRDIVIAIRKGSGAGNQSSNYAFTTVGKGTDLDTAGLTLYYVEPVAISNATSTSILYQADQGLATITVGRDGTAGPPVALNIGAGTLNCNFFNYADVGDVNGDGIPDIVVAYDGGASCAFPSAPSGFYTLLGNGDGTFQTATFTPLGSALYMVRLINFTGAAGALDVAAIDIGANYQYSVYIVPNKADGSGSFNIAKATKPINNYIITDIIPGDYNTDGKQDLTVTTIGHVDPTTETLLANTSGVLLLPGNGDYTFGTSTLTGPAHWPIGGAYADFNGDGSPDLALLQSYNNFFEAFYPPAVQILPNLGGGTFGPAIDLPDSYVAAPGLAPYDGGGFTFVGKFTNSGGTDLLVTTTNGTAEFVNRGVTSLVLTSSSATPGQGSAVTLTATLNQVVSAGVAETGSVAFTINGTAVGSTPLTNGVATLTTTALAVGSDLITATFAGDANHNQASSSLTVTVVAVAPAFALTASPATLTLAQGATGTVVISVAGNATFSGIVQIACTGAPAESSCTSSPTSVTLAAGQSAGVSVVIATTPPNNTFQAKGSRGISPWTGALSGASMAGLLLLWRRRRRVPNMLIALGLMALALGSAGSLIGCSSGGTKAVANQYPGTTAGVYTLTLTATSGALTQTQAISLTVTQ